MVRNGGQFLVRHASFACRSTLIVILFISGVASVAYSEEPNAKINASVKQQEKSGVANFIKDLGLNSRALFSTHNLPPLMVGAYAAGISSFADHSVQQYFENKNRLGDSEEVGDFLGIETFLIPATAGLFVAGRLSDNGTFRDMSYSMTQALILNTILTLTFKESVNRTRPNGYNDHSFVSGHTSSMFTIATVLNEYYGYKAGIPAYAVATFVGVSRLAGDDHYLSDVVAGAALGYIVGRTVSNRLPAEHFLLAPAFSPHRDGFGLSLTIKF